MRVDPKALMMEINKLGGGNAQGVNQQKAQRAETTTPAPSNAAQRSADEAKVQVSAEARTVQGILQNLSKTPDIDSAKVSRIKSAIDEGRYQVSAERVADKLIADEQEFKDKSE